MLESELNEQVRKLADRHKLFWVRIEDTLAAGFPDGYVGIGVNRLGRGTWLELKTAGTERERPVYRPGQLAWAARAAKLGERCMTLVASHSGSVVIYRVIRTDLVAAAAAFGDEWPRPDYIGPNLDEAVGVATGIALRFEVAWGG